MVFVSFVTLAHTETADAGSVYAPTINSMNINFDIFITVFLYFYIDSRHASAQPLKQLAVSSKLVVEYVQLPTRGVIFLHQQYFAGVAFIGTSTVVLDVEQMLIPCILVVHEPCCTI